MNRPPEYDLPPGAEYALAQEDVWQSFSEQYYFTHLDTLIEKFKAHDPKTAHIYWLWTTLSDYTWNNISNAGREFYMAANAKFETFCLPIIQGAYEEGADYE